MFEERGWHKEALKQLRNSHEEQKKQQKEASEELDGRIWARTHGPVAFSRRGAL